MCVPDDILQEVSFSHRDDCDIVATGGKGDKALFIYNVSKQGKFSKKYKLEGHKGIIKVTTMLF